jgi:hypothetical protein
MLPAVPTLPPHRRLRPGAAGLVLVLHLVGAALLLRLGTWPDRTPVPAAGPPLLLWLLPAPDPLRGAAPVPATPAPRPALARRAPAAPAPRRPDDDALQAISVPAAVDAPAPAPPAAAASATPPAPPPLNLALPRGRPAPWRERNPALEDPRSNTPRFTLEQRIAEAMGGDGEWVEEAIDADHRRIRRGRTCIYLQRPRAAQLDPFHPAHRELPWQAGTPVRC